MSNHEIYKNIVMKIWSHESQVNAHVVANFYFMASLGSIFVRVYKCKD